MFKLLRSYFFLMLLLMGFNLACSQKNKPVNNPDKIKLIGKTFKGSVGSMCVETMPPDPCAGSMYYLILKFNANNAIVTEEEVADCGKKVRKNTFTTNWDIKNNIVTVNKMILYGQQLLIKNLVLNKNHLSGTEVDAMGTESEYTFTETVSKKK